MVLEDGAVLCCAVLRCAVRLRPSCRLESWPVVSCDALSCRLRALLQDVVLCCAQLSFAGFIEALIRCAVSLALNNGVVNMMQARARQWRHSRAACCNALQRVATSYTMLQRPTRTTRCNTEEHAATHHNMM
jgi:hypothetical protein